MIGANLLSPCLFLKQTKVLIRTCQGKFFKYSIYQCFGSVSSSPIIKTKETKLVKYLHAKIKATGPITVAEYMKEALTNPSMGYYTQREVFGRKGDFITSPEISQMFGELLAVWCINEWNRLGCPSPLNIVEFGPGQGTLADDMLRVFSKFPHVKEASCLNLIEVSTRLTEIQKERLCGISNSEQSSSDSYRISRHGIPVAWFQHLEEVPHNFSIFIAHEFFDALPIHKFQKTRHGWREILIDIDDVDGPHHFRFVLSPAPTPNLLLIPKDEKRDHIEISSEASVLLQQLASRINEDGGLCLIADYGHTGSKTDTFRGFRNHQLHDPLAEPGMADLTSDVDFALFQKLVKDNVVTVGPITQGKFLTNMGIKLRLQKLLSSSQPSEHESLISGCDLLINEEKMGKRFQFLFMYPLVLKDFISKHLPAGFESLSDLKTES